MTAILHATERLLQRVAKLLESDFKNIHVSKVYTQIVLPSFPQMVAVIRDGVIVTIKSKLKVQGMDEKKRKRLLTRNLRSGL